MLADRLKQIRKEKGWTLDELAARVGTSKQTIHRYENGAITNVPPEKVEALAEALETTPADLMGWGNAENQILPLRVKRLPILGKIACGKPIYAAEEYESYTAADEGLGADFCLRAQGDSMTGAHINDGDIVFIRAQSEVENGEIAAVIIGDEATLKRFYFYPDTKKLVLSPENPRYEPLVFMENELGSIQIIGKAVAFQSLL